MNKYSKMLIDFRKKFNLTQKEASELLGFSLRSVQYIESGERLLNPRDNPDFFVSGLEFYTRKLEDKND